MAVLMYMGVVVELNNADQQEWYPNGWWPTLGTNSFVVITDSEVWTAWV